MVDPTIWVKLSDAYLLRLANILESDEEWRYKVSECQVTANALEHITRVMKEDEQWEREWNKGKG